MAKTPGYSAENTSNALGTQDFAQYRNPNSLYAANGQPIVSWIDSDGFGRGNLAAGAGLNIPVVQNSLLAIDTNTPQSVTNTNIATTVYQVAVYLESRGDGGSGTTCVATVSWSSPAGTPRTITLTLNGDTDNIQEENFAILALAGSNILVATAFSGAAFHYDISVAIVLLPTVGA